LAIGALGTRGRGTLDHYNINADQCELFCASMDTAIASVGGFCVGSAQVVDHQRLSGAGYCFSASSPPYTGTAAIEALAMMNRDSTPSELLRSKSSQLRRALSTIPQFVVAGKAADAISVNDSVSPVVHLHLTPAFSSGNREKDEAILLGISESLYNHEKIIIGLPE